MRRAFVLAAILLALLPAAAANYSAQGTSPVRGALGSNPQVFCVFVLDEGGSDECRVDGQGFQLRQARARIAGSASVYVLVDRLIDPSTNLWDQLASFNCNGATRACVANLNGVVSPPPYDGTFHLLVQVTNAAPRTTVSVSLESGSFSPF